MHVLTVIYTVLLIIAIFYYCIEFQVQCRDTRYNLVYFKNTTLFELLEITSYLTVRRVVKFIRIR